MSTEKVKVSTGDKIPEVSIFLGQGIQRTTEKEIPKKQD